MLGEHAIKTWSVTQAVIALSSGEAEYYGLVSIASELLGLQATCRDWGVCVGIAALLDATAGIAIGSRRGLGRVKHIDTVFLWVQELVSSGRLKVSKKHTSEMLADFLTKPATESVIRKCLEGLGFVHMQGRHVLAYQKTA